MSSGYLLDTNHLGNAVKPASNSRQKIRGLLLRGTKIGVCVPVLCELEAGIQQIADPTEYRLHLRSLMRQVRIWPIDQETARIFGELHQDLKRRGRVLSQVDIMLAAIATQMNLTIATTDRDFEALPKVRTENWL